MVSRFPPIPNFRFPPSEKRNDPWQYDYARVPFRLCQVTLEFDYLENGSPFVQMDTYVQTLNSKTWQGRGKRYWFCEGFSARLDSPIPTNLGTIGQDAQKNVITGKSGKVLFDWIVTRRFSLLAPPPKGLGWDPILIYVDRGQDANTVHNVSITQS